MLAYYIFLVSGGFGGAESLMVSESHGRKLTQVFPEALSCVSGATGARSLQDEVRRCTEVHEAKDGVSGELGVLWLGGGGTSHWDGLRGGEPGRALLGMLEEIPRIVVLEWVCRVGQMKGKPAAREKEQSTCTASFPMSAGSRQQHQQDSPSW